MLKLLIDLEERYIFEMKDNKYKILHIIIILLGIIFLGIPVFHTNLWFDESYSVALA